MLASFALWHLCPILFRDKHSLEFVVTCNFMKVFRTGSINFVSGCRKYFDFLPTPYRIDIQTVEFLEQYIASDNYICSNFDFYQFVSFSAIQGGAKPPLKPR